MNSGKSNAILRLIHEYHEQDKKILTIKPLMSARESKNSIVDRAGESYPADVIETEDAWKGYFKAQVMGKIKNLKNLDLVVADEAQFLEPKHVIQLKNILQKKFPGTPIMLFGLLKDYQNHLFLTSKFLVEYVDNLRELKAVCWFCGEKATCNLRLNSGHPVYEGNIVEIGGNDRYKSVCRYHYYKLLKRYYVTTTSTRKDVFVNES